MSTANSAVPSAAASPEEETERVFDLQEGDYDLDENGKLIPLSDAPANPPANQVPNNQTNNPPATDPAPGGDSGHNEGNEPAKTGIELFLEQHGVIDGQLQYGDDVVKFTDLKPNEQLEVLSQLVKEQEPVDIADDAKHINDLLKSGKDIKDIARQILADDPSVLSADEINIRDIKAQYPDFTDEEVQNELEDRKSGRNYERKSELLRSKLAPATTPALAQMSEAAKADIAKQNEADAQAIIQTVAPIADIDNLPIDEAVKNTVLAHMIEVDETGNSAFVNVQDDPARAFRMAFYDLYGDQVIQHFATRLTQAQAHAKAEYERGKAEVVNGFPRAPIGNQEAAAPKPQRPAANVPAAAEVDPLMQVNQIG